MTVTPLAVGEDVTAAFLNDIAAVTNGAQSVLSFTPTLTAATTNPTLGAGSSQTGLYIAAGDLVLAWVYITWGTGSARGSGQYAIALPPIAANTSAGAFLSVGGGRVRNAGKDALVEAELGSSSTIFLTYTANIAAGPATGAGFGASSIQMNADGTNNVAVWAGGDFIRLSLQYPAA